MKKTAHLAEESGPGRVARQEDLVAALKRDELCSRNAAGDQLAWLQWRSGIIAAMQDERWRGDAWQKIEDIDFSTRLQQPGRILGRDRDSLQVIEPAHLFQSGIRQ